MYLGDSELTALLSETLLQAEGGADWSLLQARATALSAAVEAAGGRLEGLGMKGEVAKAAACFASSDRVRGEEGRGKEGGREGGKEGGREGE